MKLTNPYDSIGRRWLKGQLHPHTTNSDGKDHAHEVARNYERRGYDFIVITDHRVVPSAADLAYGGPMLVIPGSEYRGSAEGELGVAGIMMLRPRGVWPEALARRSAEVKVTGGHSTTWSSPARSVTHSLATLFPAPHPSARTRYRPGHRSVIINEPSSFMWASLCQV